MFRKILLLLLLSISIFAQNKISVVTTLFPLYDFAKEIAGDEGNVTLILPPAIEPHSFEPTPKDMVKISKADIFIYTSEEMEPWVKKLVKTFSKNTKVLESGHGLIEEGHECNNHDHDHHDEHSKDPHIWLDPIYCQSIVNKIVEVFKSKDTSNSSKYELRGQKLKNDLEQLNKQIKEELKNCSSKTIIYAGHFAFGYFVKRYDLHFETAYHGLSPDAEPSPKKMAELIKKVKSNKSKAIFYEALIEPRLAKTISSETGAEMLLLHSASNLSREDFSKNRTYISIMQDNLKNLQKGLGCQ